MPTYSFNLLAGPLYSFTQDNNNNNKRDHSGLQNKPRFKALDQLFIKILPWEYSGYARAFESLCKKSEGI